MQPRVTLLWSLVLCLALQGCVTSAVSGASAACRSDADCVLIPACCSCGERAVRRADAELEDARCRVLECFVDRAACPPQPARASCSGGVCVVR